MRETRTAHHDRAQFADFRMDAQFTHILNLLSRSTDTQRDRYQHRQDQQQRRLELQQRS